MEEVCGEGGALGYTGCRYYSCVLPWMNNVSWDEEKLSSRDDVCLNLVRFSWFGSGGSVFKNVVFENIKIYNTEQSVLTVWGRFKGGRVWDYVTAHDMEEAVSEEVEPQLLLWSEGPGERTALHLLVDRCKVITGLNSCPVFGHDCWRCRGQNESEGRDVCPSTFTHMCTCINNHKHKETLCGIIIIQPSLKSNERSVKKTGANRMTQVRSVLLSWMC